MEIKKSPWTEVCLRSCRCPSCGRYFNYRIAQHWNFCPMCGVPVCVKLDNGEVEDA